MLNIIQGVIQDIMEAKTFLFSNVDELITQQKTLVGFKPSFVIAFASPEFFTEPQFLNTLNGLCINTIGCSTAGEVAGKQVYEHSIALVLVRFESNAYVRLYEETLPNMQSSFTAGQTLSKQIEVDKLRGIYVLAPGIDINGSALINGLLENLPKDVGISGGTAQIVGRLLRSLGSQGQVICVTHQAQVASQGHQHFFISKHEKDQTVRSAVDKLSEEERTQEIARMLGGIKITEQTIAHAKEMLSEC